MGSGVGRPAIGAELRVPGRFHRDLVDLISLESDLRGVRASTFIWDLLCERYSMPLRLKRNKAKVVAPPIDRDEVLDMCLRANRADLARRVIRPVMAPTSFQLRAPGRLHKDLIDLLTMESALRGVAASTFVWDLLCERYSMPDLKRNKTTVVAPDFERDDVIEMCLSAGRTDLAERILAPVADEVVAPILEMCLRQGRPDLAAHIMEFEAAMSA